MSLARSLGTAPPTAWFGMIVIAAYVLVAIFVDLIAPYGEREVVGAQYLPWSADHLLGTDNLGRDMLSRILYGARNTVGIEPPRDCRRLQLLRDWSHDTSIEDPEIRTRGA